MTEADWNACTDPQPMLEFLRGKASERKLRLFAVACCRQIWELLVQEGQDAVEASESYADGVIGDSELATIRNMSKLPQQRSEVISKLRRGSTQRAMQAAVMVAWGRVEAWKATVQVAQQARIASYSRSRNIDVIQANSLRCIFGPLPFRPNTLDPSLRTPTVKQLAEAIYQERAFDRLPVLADALERAGCNQPDILSHLRCGGEHCRGCWAVDLVTGRG
jgi:hypothetical protein